MSGATVRLEDVRFSYGGPELVFDLAVGSGERLALMGPSGSGKSTLLNLLAGFETPLSGRILIDGRDVSSLPATRRPVSMVFQENNLFAHLDVVANVGLGRSPSLKLTGEDRQAIERALQRTGLADKAKRLPASLSGGERQRVALARVLVRDRPVLLLDEAFAALGPALRDEMIDLVLELHAERQMTIIDATHDPLEAERLGETVAFIEDGRVAASGRMTEFLAEEAPEAFRRYLGTDPRLRRIVDVARKPS